MNKLFDKIMMEDPGTTSFINEKGEVINQWYFIRYLSEKIEEFDPNSLDEIAEVLYFEPKGVILKNNYRFNPEHTDGKEALLNCYRNMIGQILFAIAKYEKNRSGSIMIDKFYDSRLKRTILTKKDIIKALEDWGIIASLDEAKKYVELVERIKRKLPVHLQNEILKNE